MRYGFIGLGNLGGHLAVSLLKAGFEVTVNDLDPGLASAMSTWAAPGPRHRRNWRATVTRSSPACRRRRCRKRCSRRC
jgi:3-hydroxyisobutyrate dehydrogenase